MGVEVLCFPRSESHKGKPLVAFGSQGLTFAEAGVGVRQIGGWCERVSQGGLLFSL